MSGLVRKKQEKGLAALADSTFLHNRTMLLTFGTFQAATLILAIFITALKPWKKKEKIRKEEEKTTERKR